MKTVTIAIDIPEGRFKGNLSAVDFVIITTQGTEADDLIKKLPGDDKAWTPSCVTAEIAATARVIKEN